MKLYFECASGISGDMTVAALLDLGASKERLLEGLSSLQLPGYHLHIGRASKCGIDACDFDVHLEDHAHNHEHHHDHDHEHEHHHDHDHDHEHHHDHDHEHHHDHDHDHEHHHDHGHTHSHRGMPEIRAIIQGSGITDGAKALALEIFETLALAESKAHNLPVDQVHFHEVGAVDSIVDIVGAAICIDDLHPEAIRFSPLSEGTGTVRCQHGVIPVPVPAVANLAAARDIPLKMTDTVGEMVTPTGAAIAAVLSSGWGAPENWSIRKIGIGAGKKDFGHANILRVFAYEDAPAAGDNAGAKDGVWQLEANIDDQSGEELAFAMEQIFRAGALDCWFTPITMKKSRPAVMISALCREEQKDAVARAILRHTSTIGVRMNRKERLICSRESITVTTPWGEALAKRCVFEDMVRVTAEYESARKLAEAHQLPLHQVMDAIVQAAKE